MKRTPQPFGCKGLKRDGANASAGVTVKLFKPSTAARASKTRLRALSKVRRSHRVKANEVEVRVEEGAPYVRQLSRRELQDVVTHVEDVILRGTAQVQDYEDFVLCKQELVRRARPG